VVKKLMSFIIFYVLKCILEKVVVYSFFFFILPCPAKLWPLVKLWPKLVKIPNGFQNIRFTPLEIRGTVTDISD
jgi:hypothetical protein